MITIPIFKEAGSFAENKDKARQIRLESIIPALNEGQEVILDFSKVKSVTQSFIHALISDLFRLYGNNVLDKLSFKSCDDTVKTIISIVVEYMQESLEE